MTQAIRGKIWNSAASGQVLAFVKVQLLLDIGSEFEDPPLTASELDRPWTALTDREGRFTLPMTDRDVAQILAGRRHREVLFKIYDNSNAVLLGSQTAHVSVGTFRGTTEVSLSADPSYTTSSTAPNFVVSGFVTETDGTPIASTVVTLLKKTLRTTTVITSATCGSDGRFLIRYTGTPGGSASNADFSVYLAANSISATAGAFCNPPTDFTVRLVRTNAAYRGSSDFNLNTAVLTPLLDTATFDQLTVDDVGFLICRTELDGTMIATTARAHSLALKYGVPAATFIALSHAGISLGTNSVAGLSAQRITDAINRAIGDNAVPSSLATSLPTIITALTAARVERMVPSVNPQSTTLGAILVAASLPTGTPHLFAQAYIANTDPPEDFWGSLRGNPAFGSGVVDKIQFALQVGAISASHPPLVKLLESKRTNNVFNKAAELAQYDEQDWVNFFAETVDGAPVHTPAGMAGEDDEAQRANYAAAITLMIADLYPSAHLAYHLPEGAVTSPTNVIKFVIDNPGFSFQRTVLKNFFPTASGLPALQADKDALLRDLLKLQRVSAISPRYGRTAAASALLGQGITSARQIQEMGISVFKAKMSQTMDAATVAAVYENAAQVAATTTEAWLAMRSEMYVPSTAVIPKPASSNPNLTALFGSLDYCACNPCDSILGPAAYFVDIMRFVQTRMAFDLLLLNLAGRRPELLYVDLNCENVSTPMPTIDLVNEVLEARAQWHLGLGAADENRQTTWTADELLVHPEHLNRPVYTALATPAAAHFPLALPFDLQIEEARAYLQSLGLSLLDVQDELEWFPGLEEAESFRVNERLGLSSGQADIIRNVPGTPSLERLWGFASGDNTWQTQMNDVETFLTRTGLDFQGLKDLLLTKDLVDHTKIQYEVPCKLEDARFVSSADPEQDGLDPARLRMLQGFLRVQRALGLTTAELDATSRALSLSFDAAGLLKLATFVRLRRKFARIPLGELLSWLAPLDRYAYGEGARSYYDEVIQPNTRNSAFATALDGSTKLGAVRGDLLGILRIDEASLAAIYAGTGLSDTSDLTLPNLSTLYRVASIARAVGLSARDLVTLTHYTQTLNEGAGPFSGGLTTALRELIDVAEAARHSGFTVPALDWVLRNQDPDSFHAGDLDVTNALIGLITTLRQAKKDHDESLPPSFLSWQERAESLLGSVHSEDKVVAAMKFIRKEPPEPASEQSAAEMRDELLFFLMKPDDLDQFATLFAQAESAEARAQRVVEALGPWLLSRVLVQKMATNLGLSVVDTDTLLRQFNSTNYAFTLFTSDAFLDASSYDPVTDGPLLKEVNFPADFLARPSIQIPAQVYRDLCKVALLTSTFRLGPGLLHWLLSQPTDPQVKLPNLAHLPGDGGNNSAVYDAFAGWDWLRRAVRLRDEVLVSDPAALTLLLEDAFNLDKTALLKHLAHATGWVHDELTAFEAEEPVAPLSFKNLEAFEAFAAAFRLGARLAVDPATVCEWARAAPMSGDVVDAIRNAVQANFSGSSWTAAALPIRNRLRERQRDALAEYIVHKEGLTSREDLVGHRLLDVDMAPCNRTTRLLFATAAVQLFMQRALMGLVPGITLTDEDADEWTWMKRYRVWEANRKVFLYPENWVHPELRDDKSSLFKRLEDELAQGQVDDAAIEKAYIHYLEGLHEISHLEVSGMYHEKESDNGVVTIDRMHVFARSAADPAKLFYRRREDDAYWTAWEELPFQVEHKGILPLVLNRRLMVLWPKIEQTASPEIEGFKEGDPPPAKRLRVHLMWAEKNNDTWGETHSQELPDFNWYPEADEPGLKNYNVRMESHGPYIEIAVGQRHTVTQSLRLKLSVCNNTFTVEDVETLDPIANIDTEDHGRYNSPSHTISAYQHFIQDDKAESGTPISIPFIAGFTVDTDNEYGSGIGGSENAQYSGPIIIPDAEFHLSMPRQEWNLQSTLPLIYSDNNASLYMRTYTSVTHGDGHPDKIFTKQVSMVPYLGLAGVVTEAMPPPQNVDIAHKLKGGDNPAALQQWESLGKFTKYDVWPFFHPHTCLFLERVRRFGVAGLLDPAATTKQADDVLLYQQASHDLNSKYFTNIKTVHTPVPAADIDFRYGGAYSVYNWELFFHVPLYVAGRLMTERRFADAQRWLGYVFNPLRKPTLIEETSSVHYWNLKEFRETSENLSIDLLLELLHYDGPDSSLHAKKKQLRDQIEQMRRDPFRPHTLARLRPTAYMRAVVMKYLDNLIAWGDDLFREDTRESTQEAAQIYFLALQILGKRPRAVDCADRPDKDYYDAHDALDAFSNFLVGLENDSIGLAGKYASLPFNSKAQADYQDNYPNEYKLVFVNSPLTAQTTTDAAKYLPSKPMPFLQAMPSDGLQGSVDSRLYFCIPPNDKLLGYWDTVADRLFKLHNCLNIEGIRRDLALFEPPIDPGLLARAVAQGIDIGTAINSVNAPLPHYRFLPHLGIAKDFVAQVTSLGTALVQALEKRDAESLAVLRGHHEVDLLKLVRSVRESAVKEAEENIVALQRGRDVAVRRESYYSTREFMNELEKAEVALSLDAANTESAGAASMVLAAKLALIPQLSIGMSGWIPGPHLALTTGGNLPPQLAQITGQRLNMVAAQKSREAARTATQASYTRRQEEWDFQVSLARTDIKQIDAQITAAEIRKKMAEIELANHDKQVEQSAEALDFMQSKFTSSELYAWMSAELSKVYHMTYQLALDLARRAERCYHFELADESTTDFIQFGHWDNLRRGLLAGERLAHDLRRMEAAYYQNNRREYELTKRISLASLDPVALIALRKTGACHFSLPSVLFNLDHSSHYLRRIKLVGLSIPAVTGPYTNIGATLTYESGSLRARPNGGLDQAAGAAQSVAISVNQEDTGLFEPNLRDERYLPFEGRALEDSKWRVELPKAVRQFDYETISDVILTVRYTAREGGITTANLVGDLMNAADKGLNTFKRADFDLDPAHGKGQVQMFSARAEFSEAWRTFVAAGASGTTTLSLDLNENRFAHPQLPPGSRSIEGVVIFARWAADETVAPSGPPVFDGSFITPQNEPAIGPFGFTNFHGGEPAVGAKYNYLWIATPTLGDSKELGTWTLQVPGWQNGHAPEDIIIVVAHKVS